jgi:phenylacetate-CoA oxygenase PaaH subunit
MGARRDHRSGRRGGLRAIAGAMSVKDRVWEVFRQEAEGDPMVHGGSVKAPDEELATHYAREFYGRRQESERLWIVPRDAILELDDPDLLKPPFDRSFKRPGGFLIKHKLEAARERAGSPSADEVGE